MAAQHGGTQTVLFRRGFRPFFLIAGLYTCLTTAVWLTWLGLHLTPNQILPGITLGSPFLWHAHEMLFGYVVAAIAGFLLTATPNWTGRAPLEGQALILLVGLWLLGRAVWWGLALFPASVVAGADLLFLPALAAALTPPLWRAGGWRNQAFVPVLLLLWGANLLVHLELLGITTASAGLGHRLAVDLIVLLIAIIGGRIIPTFTGNWLRSQGVTASPSRRPWIDRFTLSVTVAVLASDLVNIGTQATATLALLAAVGHLVRLLGWQPGWTLGNPLLWILHLGYAWLVIAFACRGLSLLTPAIPQAAALHAFTVGAIGSMTLGVMSRAALGHTGRALEVSRGMAGAYLLVSVAAALRVFGPIVAPPYYMLELLLAGALWLLAFGIFVATYWPVLTGARIDGRPG